MRHIPNYFERGESGLLMDSLTAAGEVACRADGAICSVMLDGRAVWVRMNHRGLFELYWRHDLGPGVRVPDTWVPSEENYRDFATWHGWVRCEERPKFRQAMRSWMQAWRRGGEDDPKTKYPTPGTYELCGPGLGDSGETWIGRIPRLLPHCGITLTERFQTYDELRTLLAREPIKGLVWWVMGEPVAKLRRTDLGFPWPLGSGGSDGERRAA